MVKLLDAPTAHGWNILAGAGVCTVSAAAFISDESVNCGLSTRPFCQGRPISMKNAWAKAMREKVCAFAVTALGSVLCSVIGAPVAEAGQVGLFARTSNSSIVQIDLATASTTYIGRPGLDLGSIAFDPLGQLYATTSNSSIVEIDLTTAAATYVGRPGLDLGSIAFRPMSVPEPQSLALTLTALAGVGVSLRSRRRLKSPAPHGEP